MIANRTKPRQHPKNHDFQLWFWRHLTYVPRFQHQFYQWGELACQSGGSNLGIKTPTISMSMSVNQVETLKTSFPKLKCQCSRRQWQQLLKGGWPSAGCWDLFSGVKVQHAVGKSNLAAFAIFRCPSGPCEMATQRELGQNGPGDKAMFTSATMILQF